MSRETDEEVSGEERAEELTRDAWKRGISPKELWATPVHQLLFVWFRQPDEVPAEKLEIVSEGNQRLLRPFIPSWLMPEYRG